MALHIRYNAPVVLTFSLACIAIYYINYIIWGDAERNFNGLIPWLFTTPHYWSWSNPLDYLRLFTHSLGHANQAHVFGNISMILLVAPLIEEKYGSANTIKMMLVTAGVTAIFQVLLFNSVAYGASGLLFMFIILSSFADVKKGSIPLTFILVAIFYLGKEIVGSFQQDNVSQYAHIAGGLMGAAFGFAAINPKKPAE